ncbi:hypothetical protein [Bradyrhizobium yuanmingense]|uniref:hypothetical protein n=1 Tax=Bradyrhizobium yuanmingense TaxID=108015 RepID=UPI001CD2DBC8|nr:hypothetical protein [Bradyrhizobium yuanmingense]MCA1530871.1 hypothetical protein [Bradyrhizobium yuanmingense]
MDADKDPQRGNPDRPDAAPAGRPDHRQSADPDQGYRSCLGIIRLEKRIGAERLEATALRALEIQAHNYPSVKSILEKGLDRVPTPASPEREPIIHTNIRGSGYYH